MFKKIEKEQLKAVLSNVNDVEAPLSSLKPDTTVNVEFLVPDDLLVGGEVPAEKVSLVRVKLTGGSSPVVVGLFKFAYTRGLEPGKDLLTSNGKHTYEGTTIETYDDIRRLGLRPIGRLLIDHADKIDSLKLQVVGQFPQINPYSSSGVDYILTANSYVGHTEFTQTVADIQLKVSNNAISDAERRKAWKDAYTALLSSQPKDPAFLKDPRRWVTLPLFKIVG